MHTAGQHKVRVRPATPGGMLRKGNRNTINTGRTIVLAADQPRPWHGDAGTMPSQGALNAMAERQMSAGWTKKKNKLCPACGCMRSAMNHCFCNS